MKAAKQARPTGWDATVSHPCRALTRVGWIQSAFIAVSRVGGASLDWPEPRMEIPTGKSALGRARSDSVPSHRRDATSGHGSLSGGSNK